MKKLMIAAAVAAMTVGAFADCGEGNIQTSKAQVYKFTFSGKTTKGLKAGSTKVDCGEDGAGCHPRVATKLKIKGWVAYCLPVCTETLPQGTGSATAWSFWMLKPFKGGFNGTDALADTMVNVIGKKPNKAEMFGKFNGTISFAENVDWNLGDLYFAGLGKYKGSKGIYSSISGNFAGSPAASWYVSPNLCKQTDVYDCATLQLVCDQNPNTVAFGKWSVKYNKSASKKLTKSISNLPKTPSYATVTVAE